MSRLGAILAGGRSSRFGSDKAAALIGELSLLDHVADALRPQVDALVVVGRAAGIADQPAPDLGPLGGLCAALGEAKRRGFAEVLTAGCDVLPVPGDLARLLSPGPAVIAGQPLFGLWPAALHDALLARLEAGGDRSLRGWIAATGARQVAAPVLLHNLNTPADVARYRQREGQAA